jgi:glycosyltransferase involved in cell wall biosynthesis
MKLLLYSHSFTPNVGGVETIVMSLARGLAELRTVDHRHRFELTVVTETPSGDFDDSALPFPVARQPSLLTLWRLTREADVVHLAGPALLPLVLAWLARKPVALEHHGYQAICLNGLLVHQPDGSICPGNFQAGRYGKCVRCQAAEMSWLRSLMSLLLMYPRNMLARRVACNIAVSQHVLERIALPSSRVVYHGVDTASASAGVSEFPVSPATLRFAYVGRLVAEKGLPVLLEAAALLKREKREFELLFELMLIGDGPQRPPLEAMIQRYGLRDCVHITGFLEGAALIKKLESVHVVIMPSTWEEAAGLAAMEQMMRGRLVIASKVGGLAETVGDAGLLCRPGDAADLARCMREALQDRSLVTSLGRKGQERAASLFLRDRMIAEHVTVYREIGQRDS